MGTRISFLNKQKKGLELSTQSYTLKEVIILSNILRIKFNLNPRIHESRPDDSIYKNKTSSENPLSVLGLALNLKNSSSAPNRPRVNYKIYLNSVDLNKIRPFILPYFVKHFLYKIN